MPELMKIPAKSIRARTNTTSNWLLLLTYGKSINSSIVGTRAPLSGPSTRSLAGARGISIRATGAWDLRAAYESWNAKQSSLPA